MLWSLRMEIAIARLRWKQFTANSCVSSYSFNAQFGQVFTTVFLFWAPF